MLASRAHARQGGGGGSTGPRLVTVSGDSAAQAPDEQVPAEESEQLEYLPPEAVPPNAAIDPDGTVWCDDGQTGYICGFTDPLQPLPPPEPDPKPAAVPSIGQTRTYNPSEVTDEKERKKLQEKIRELEEVRRTDEETQALTRERMNRMQKALEKMTHAGPGSLPGKAERAERAPKDARAGNLPREAAQTQRPPLSVSRPSSKEDLALAAFSGYGHVFKKAGLDVRYRPDGKPAFYRGDGKPAGEQEIQALRAAISAEPEALAKRPDFFRAIPRERYDRLKTTYLSGADHGDALLHVGMTDSARDFRWEQSCSSIAEKCNPNSVKRSYKKDALIEPESLENMWEDIFREETAEDAGEKNEQAAIARDKLSRRMDFSSLSGMVSAIASKASGLFGGLADASPEGAVLAGMQPMPRSEGPGYVARAKTSAPPRLRLGSGKPVPGVKPSPPPSPADLQRSRALFWLVVAAALSLVAFLAFRKKRRTSEPYR